MATRPKLPPPSETTRHLAALLADEALRWPDVTIRPMFGMRALHRAGAIFAMLPDRRALESPTAIACKLNRKWRLVELESAPQMPGSLAVLEQAYRQAARKTVSK